MPLSIKQLSNKIQTIMDDEAKKLYPKMPKDYRLRTEERVEGMHRMARRLGVNCACFRVGARGAAEGYEECKCSPMSAKEKSQVNLAALAGCDQFGDGCRDAKGFVPMPACMGPVDRDPRTGRYISIKGYRGNAIPF